MTELIIICKTIVSVAMAAAVGVGVYGTDEPNCLWALFFVAAVW